MTPCWKQQQAEIEWRSHCLACCLTVKRTSCVAIPLLANFLCCEIPSYLTLREVAVAVAGILSLQCLPLLLLHSLGVVAVADGDVAVVLGVVAVVTGVVVAGADVVSAAGADGGGPAALPDHAGWPWRWRGCCPCCESCQPCFWPCVPCHLVRDGDAHVCRHPCCPSLAKATACTVPPPLICPSQVYTIITDRKTSALSGNKVSAGVMNWSTGKLVSTPVQINKMKIKWVPQLPPTPLPPPILKLHMLATKHKKLSLLTLNDNKTPHKQ